MTTSDKLKVRTKKPKVSYAPFCYSDNTHQARIKKKVINEIIESGAKYVVTSVSREPCAVAIAIQDIEGVDDFPCNFEWRECSTGLNECDY